MGEAIGQALPLAVGIALSPIPIIGVVLMLGTPRARQNGPAFVCGWVVGLVGVGTVVLLIAGGANASENGSPSDWASVVKLALGLVLLWVASKQWRGRPRPGEQAALPSWMESVDHFGAPRSAALALALSAVNPKNLLLIVAAATAISQTGISAGDQAIAFAVFVAVAALGPTVPVILYFAMGERSKSLLDELRQWMAHNNATIMAVICLLIAAKLIGDGIGGF